MKRQPVHIAFGVIATVLTIVSIQLAQRLHSAERSNTLIASASQPSADAKAVVDDANDVDTPEAALARAIALAQGEDYERALRAFEPLTLSPRADIRLIARYDLGNLHMRQSARIVNFEVAKARTLVELGKQSYRRALDENPQHWPSRYNLDRALWLEPEADDKDVETTPPPTLDRPNGDKPELP